MHVCVFGSSTHPPLLLVHLLSSLHPPSHEPSFLRPPPPREIKVGSLHQAFWMYDRKYYCKANVMFEIFALPDQRFHQENTYFFFFSLPPLPLPPIILCLRYSLLDYIDLYIMYFSCVFVCVFFGFILTATATVYNITTCILKNGFNLMYFCMCLCQQSVMLGQWRILT